MKSPADSYRTISCDSYGIDPIRCDWYTRPKTQDDYHSHLDFYELVVVLEGSGRDEWEGKELKLVPGIFFVYAPGSRHIYTHLRNFHYMQVLFSSELLQIPKPLSLSDVPGFVRLIPKQGSRSENFLLGESDMVKVLDMMISMRTVYLSHNKGWKEETFSALLQLLFWLMRHLIPADAFRSGTLCQQISRAIRYMEEHVKENTPNRELARQLGMSESSFLHHFKRITGFSPAQYWIRLRLKRSLVLLITSSQISTVAMESGFQDVTYFYRQFKKHFSIMPHEMHNILISQHEKFNDFVSALMKPSSPPVICNRSVHRPSRGTGRMQ